MWNKKRMACIGMLVGILAGSWSVQAEPVQEQTEAQIIEEQTTEQESVDGAFIHAEEFSTEHSMSGLFSECSEYFSAGDWEIHDAKFYMVYSVSQLKDEEISDYTLSLNGKPFHSARFTEASEELQTVEIQIPTELIREGINELKVESYIRTEESLPCVDDVSKANWFRISKDSAVSIAYQPKEKELSIASVYSELTGIYALENQKAALLLPEEATDTAMTAAANILTGISGNAAVDYQKLMLLRESSVFGAEAQQKPEFALYVAEWEFLPEELRNALPAEAKKEAREKAVLATAALADMKVLVLTGSDEKELLKGAAMLGNAAYMQQMEGQTHSITQDENPALEKSSFLEYRNLTEEGAYVNGAFRQVYTFTQSTGANKMLSPASAVYLKMRYSENLDFNRSLVTVYVNDIPIGSQKLSKENANEDEAELYFPADLKISGDFQVKVAFDLELEDLWCTLRQEEMPWAYVSPESMMKLVLAEETPLFFEYYPAPFLEAKSLNDVLIALPEHLTQEELEAMRGICLTLGRFLADNNGSLSVKQGAEEADCKGKNVIVIGTFADNKIIRENNKRLYFPFNEDGSVLLGNEKKRITREAGARMGAIQLLELPSGEKNRGMLFVTGAVPEAVELAAEYLSDTDKLWNLKGDGCVVSEEEIFTYQFKETDRKIAKTAKELMKREDILRLFVISISVAGILILGLLFILVKYIRKGKKVKKGEK